MLADGRMGDPADFVGWSWTVHMMESLFTILAPKDEYGALDYLLVDIVEVKRDTMNIGMRDHPAGEVMFQAMEHEIRRAREAMGAYHDLLQQSMSYEVVSAAKKADSLLAADLAKLSHSAQTVFFYHEPSGKLAFARR